VALLKNEPLVLLDVVVRLAPAPPTTPDIIELFTVLPFLTLFSYLLELWDD
jgi:hypothetical protein